MTTSTTTPAPRDVCDIWAQIQAQHAACARLIEETLPANKSAIFAALAEGGIACVVVSFDGCGDSGQIQDIEARIGDARTGDARLGDARLGDAPAELPTVAVEIATPVWDGSGLDRRTLPLAEAIEALVYVLLEDTHDGWEINAGAFGEFSFDVEQRAVRLDYNERIDEPAYTGHEW